MFSRACVMFLALMLGISGLVLGQTSQVFAQESIDKESIGQDFLAQTSVVGTWEMTSNSPMGELNSVVIISETEEGLTGTIQNQFAGLREFARVTDNAGMVSLQLSLPGKDGPVTIAYEGYLEGDRMMGIVMGPAVEPERPTGVSAETSQPQNTSLDNELEEEPEPGWDSEFTAIRVLIERMEDEE
jgi:hypothetical protein